jgi:aspartate racemase
VKTLGLIGGMSWESTSEYYRLLNQGISARLGNSHSAELLLYSFDFAVIEALQHDGSWDRLAELMIDAALKLERTGAEILLLCTNTMHVVFESIQSAVDVPIIHIADAAGEAITRAGLSTLGLLGTKFTMEGDFYRTRLTDAFGLEILVPDENDREIVHKVIYNELCRGVVDESSRSEYVRIIDELAERGAKGIVLGCTEIPLLVDSSHTAIPLFDTTELHVAAALDTCLNAGETMT